MLKGPARHTEGGLLAWAFCFDKAPFWLQPTAARSRRLLTPPLARRDFAPRARVAGSPEIVLDKHNRELLDKHSRALELDRVLMKHESSLQKHTGALGHHIVRTPCHQHGASCSAAIQVYGRAARDGECAKLSTQSLECRKLSALIAAGTTFPASLLTRCHP